MRDHVQADRRVVVTGMGAVSPLGNDLATSWEAAKQGISGIGPITRFDARHWPARIAGEVRGFCVEPYLDPRQPDRSTPIPRGTQMGLAAAVMAMQDAGLEGSAHDPARWGIAMGAMGSYIDLQTMSEWRSMLCEHEPPRYPPLGENVSLGRPQVAVPRLLAQRWQAAGPNFEISTACAASAQALGTAMRVIQRGDADVMLAGGYDSPVQEVTILCFALLGALAKRNDEPQRASRPFDRDRDGFVMGEGAAVLVLEEFDHARRRGATIHAELAGYGTTMTTYHITDSVPDGTAPARAIALALEGAQVEPAQVAYVNAHGTSTLDNDRSESAAIRRVFGEHVARLAVSSTKSMTGHLVHAAGALEAAFTVLALRDQVAPPTLNYETPDPKCDLDYVPNVARQIAADVAASNSFAFGGNNAVLVFRKL
ncbi:MAG: beta-ketoacyl-[acyl-carrier-protein] synthase II [Planctomycetes bacterium]|nr:beta-ketoacyl-[acyl-carrier-protein] synthase II [Planctomycetota bacterium]